MLDAFAPHARHDPYPAYEVLRAAGPFVPGPLGTHLVTRYADCEEILQDSRWSHAEERDLLHPDSDVELPGSFLWMEPPDHTRLRRLVSAAFTPRRIEGMRAHAETVVDRLLGAALADGETDLIESLAYPLPLTMVCDLLGVPGDAHADVRRMSAASRAASTRTPCSAPPSWPSGPRRCTTSPRSSATSSRGAGPTRATT